MVKIDAVLDYKSSVYALKKNSYLDPETVKMMKREGYGFISDGISIAIANIIDGLIFELSEETKSSKMTRDIM